MYIKWSASRSEGSAVLRWGAGSDRNISVGAASMGRKEEGMAGTNDRQSFPGGGESDPGTPPRTEPPVQELRKHLRIQIDDASTSFSIKGVSTSLGSGRVSRGRAAINLSECGAMLLVNEAIPVGSRVIVRIEIEEREEFVEASGEVRWCEPEGGNGKDFHAGIGFVGLSPEDHRKIARMQDWFGSPEYRSRRSTSLRKGL